MHYSFRNTLYGLAVVVAAGLLAEQANAQTVTLEEDDAVVSLEPVNGGMSAPEEISLFDEQETEVSGSNGLIAPSQPTTSVATDLIPMEGSDTSDSMEDISLSIEGESSTKNGDVKNPLIENSEAQANATPAAGEKIVSDTPPVLSGKLLGAKAEGGFDQNISPSIGNELFQKMSDLEKQTTLLNLELKKERVQNEIAAVKAQRQKALEEKIAKEKEEERKKQEWQNEQDRLMIAEQTKLKEAEAALERLRQEKIVKAYKETMLENTQKWIKINADAYKEVAAKNAEIKSIMDDNAKKMNILRQTANDLMTKAEAARIAHDKKVANLESQISILKTRLENEIEASKKKIAAAKAEGSAKRNPFATSAGLGLTAVVSPTVAKLSDEYAIMEITGQNDQLAAKLINVDGDLFMAKVGTTLRNGYTIDEITKTYVSAVKDDKRDILYFSAGGVLEQEPVPSTITPNASFGSGADANGASGGSDGASNAGSRGSRGRRVNATKGIPSLGQGMFIR